MKEVAFIILTIGLIIGLAIDLSRPDGSECLKIASQLDTTGTNTNPLISCVVNVGVGEILAVVFGSVIAAFLSVIGNLAG